MDELFLQILKANEAAQEHIERAQGTTQNAQDVFKEMKKTVDQVAQVEFEKESIVMKEKSDAVIRKAESDEATSLQRKKEIFKHDFVTVSEAHRANILSEIFDGK